MTMFMRNFKRLRCHCAPLLLTFGLSLAAQLIVSAQESRSGELPVVSVPLSLADALHLADQSNVSLAQIRATSESSQADAERARAATKLSISTTTYATTGDEPSIVTSAPGVMPQNLFGVPRLPFADQDLMLMAPLWTGGMLQRRVAAAGSDADASRSDVEASRLATRQSVVESYIDVLLQDALAETAGSRLTAELEQVRITEEKVSTGRLAPVDLLREQAELADAQSGVSEARANSDLAMVDLKGSLGVSQISTLTVTDSLVSLSQEDKEQPLGSLPDSIALAVKNRPELVAAQRRLTAAVAAVSAAKGAYAPQIYAVGMADEMAGQDMRVQTGYTVGLTASLPLYDGGARKADVDGAVANQDRAIADARAAQLAVEKDVARAWLTLQSVHDQVVSAQAGLVASQQGYDLANLRYNAGKSTTSERLDALASLTRAKGAWAQALAEEVITRTRLNIELGKDPPRFNQRPS